MVAGFLKQRIVTVSLTLVLVGLMAAGLSACGRKGALEAPDGSTYPQEYPTE